MSIWDMTDEDFDVYYILLLEGALKEGFLTWVSDYVIEMAQAPPKKTQLETPLDLGTIVMTPGAKERLGDDDVINSLRRLRWGDYGDVQPEVVVSNDEIVASGIIEPLLGVYVMESGACARIETYVGRYTTVLLPSEAAW